MCRKEHRIEKKQLVETTGIVIVTVIATSEQQIQSGSNYQTPLNLRQQSLFVSPHLRTHSGITSSDDSQQIHNFLNPRTVAI